MLRELLQTNRKIIFTVIVIITIIIRYLYYIGEIFSYRSVTFFVEYFTTISII